MTTQALEQKTPFSLKGWIDRYPHYFLMILIMGASIFFIEPASWLTLTLAGLAMGLLIFIMSSGMTLTFGLMHVLNLGHGAFITLGAFIGAAVLASMRGMWGTGAGDALTIIPAILVAMLVAAVGGLIFERLIIRPVYSDVLKQILVTVGGGIVIVELVKMAYGASPIAVPQPDVVHGSFAFGEVTFSKYRLVAVVVGLAIYAGMLYVINKTRVGLLIRAGVEKVEMVEALGYRIRLLFIAVFVAASALAACGGVMWALYEESITIAVGDARLVQVIIVIIIGGLGSVTGCFYGALLVGLLTNYIGFLAPSFAEFSSIGLMVAVLMWRPQGLIPVIKV